MNIVYMQTPIAQKHMTKSSAKILQISCVVCKKWLLCGKGRVGIRVGTATLDLRFCARYSSDYGVSLRRSFRASVFASGQATPVPCFPWGSKSLTLPPDVVDDHWAALVPRFAEGSLCGLWYAKVHAGRVLRLGLARGLLVPEVGVKGQLVAQHTTPWGAAREAAPLGLCCPAAVAPPHDAAAVDVLATQTVRVREGMGRGGDSSGRQSSAGERGGGGGQT